MVFRQKAALYLSSVTVTFTQKTAAPNGNHTLNNVEATVCGSISGLIKIANRIN